MDAIAPYFHVPEQMVEPWKAFMYTRDGLVDTFRRQVDFEAGEHDTDMQKQWKAKQLEAVSSDGELEILMDDFNDAMIRIARQCKCTPAKLCDEINDNALLGYRTARMVKQHEKGHDRGKLWFHSGYYIDDWIERERQEFLNAQAWQGCD